jgi:hypothetical protein
MMRAECQHFREWMESLQALPSRSAQTEMHASLLMAHADGFSRMPKTSTCEAKLTRDRNMMLDLRAMLPESHLTSDGLQAVIAR